VPGKRVQFDQETWNAIDLLARYSMKDSRNSRMKRSVIFSKSMAGQLI